MNSIKKYIAIDSSIRFGKPCIKGTRISVFDVLNWLASGMTKEDIQDDFPEITIEAINSCLLFAANRESHIAIAS